MRTGKGAHTLARLYYDATGQVLEGHHTAPADARALVPVLAGGALANELITAMPTHVGAYDGFTGMMALHPAQVPIINAAFTPSAEQIQHARAVIDAFAQSPDAGVLLLDGRMIDAPHLLQARKLLARAGLD